MSGSVSDVLLCTFRQATIRFQLDRPAASRVRKRLDGKQLPFRSGTEYVYRIEDVKQAVLAYQAAALELSRHADPAEPPATRPCTSCGAPIPFHWILDRCHACCRVMRAAS